MRGIIHGMHMIRARRTNVERPAYNAILRLRQSLTHHALAVSLLTIPQGHGFIFLMVRRSETWPQL